MPMTTNKEKAGARLVEATRALVPLLREQAAAMDREGRPTRVVLEALNDALLYRIDIPEEFRGLDGVRIPDRVKAMYELGRGNGSVGWGVIQNNSLVRYLRAQTRLDERALRELFELDHAGPLACGAFYNLDHALGIGEKVDGGMSVYGSWSFSSNIRITAFMLQGMTWQEGDKSIRGFALIPRQEAEVADDWRVTGLMASNSNTAFIRRDKSVFVPEYRTMPVFDEDFLEGAEEYPYDSIALELAGMAIGMASAAYELFVDKVTRRAPWGMPYELIRDMPTVQVLAARARAAIDVALGRLLQNSETIELGGKETPPDVIASADFEAIWLSHQMRDIVDQLRQVIGSSTLAVDDAIGRYARDIDALCLHVTFRRDWVDETRGRELLGAQMHGEVSMSTSKVQHAPLEPTNVIDEDEYTGQRVELGAI
ncbi:MAG TPA: hypothetical protein VNT53_11870 [Pseudolysinimonas sp.]|nr:hypothetical protein [Pseudolysinimonas sp.]